MDNTMDPELASEMVKLLAQELKVVRTQLREAERGNLTAYMKGFTHERAQALITENETFKADNAALQERVAELQDERTRVSSIKLEEDLPGPLQYAEVPTSHMNGEFARLLAENQDLIREKEEASRNHEKFSILGEKYRRSKAKVYEYNEMLNELLAALSSCVEELEQSRKVVVAEIDFRSFLRTLLYEPVVGQPEFSSIQSYSRHIHTELYKDVTEFHEGLCFIDCNEVIWSPSGIALGLVIKPTFQYNPKISSGAWTKLEDDFDIGKQMDLCHLSSESDKTYRYLGIYERVADHGPMIIAPETLKHLDRKKLNYVSRRTMLFPDWVPPSQARMIKNMYRQGVIKLQCFVIRCVGVNQTFAEKLRDASVTSGNTRKRKREVKWVGHSTRNPKKRKH